MEAEKPKYSLAVLIPFYNEEMTLSKSLERVNSVDIIDQIILINDCSTDQSYEIANRFCEKNSKVRLISTINNQGKGAALKIAKNYINTSHVVVHDADLEYDPIDIIEMFNIAIKYPKALILGSRFIGNKNRSNIYKRTKFANISISFIFSLFHSYKISDVATCYKLFPSEFFKNIEINEKGFSIEVEILSKFIQWNRFIKEVPISYFGRSYSEGKKIKAIDGFWYIFNIIRYRYKQN